MTDRRYFETRSTPPPEHCRSGCYWVEGTTIAVQGDTEIEIPEWRRLSNGATCPEHGSMPPPHPISRCGAPRCGARIIWAKTNRGKDMPVNVDPDQDNGNIVLEWRGHDLYAVVLTKAQTAKGFARTLYTSHFTNCRNADVYRTKGR